MPQNFERNFLEEVRKLKRKKRKHIAQKIGIILLIALIAIGFIYFWLQSNLFLKIGNMSISTKPLVLIIIGLLIILTVYIINNPSAKLRYQSFLSSLELLKTINYKYFIGFTLLIIALVYQANPFIIINPVNDFVTHLVYKPTPPVLNSPWPWTDHQKIHPIVVNMPSEVETSIKSVAEYIAKQESDPYLRIKALHDYVISRVTYDLEVLKTGIRPPQDAQTVFQTHKAVCEGYANLFMALGQNIGTKVVYIQGKIRQDLAPIELIPKVLRLLKSNYDWTLHAWNAVKVADNWQLVDTTWDDSDSNALGSSYSADYLMPPPQVMSMSHFPSHLNWQLLSIILDQNNFEKQPILTPQFFTENLLLISPTEYQTNVKNAAEILIKTPANYQKRIAAIFTKIKEVDSSIWDLPKDNQEERQQNFNKCQSQQNTQGKIHISCQFPEVGDYQVLVFSVGKNVSPIGQMKFHAL
ncbi:transglutaminase domain-containing protein [Calothrix sp. PCC 7507]|nr:transglutaminase domain-containing protein [Calothrix sp. PCC 7507]